MTPTAATADLTLLAAGVAAGARGVCWTLPPGGDMNANLVTFPDGEGVAEHVNDEVDVLILGVSGTGTLTVEGRPEPLAPGRLVLVPRGARRSTRAESGRLSYLTVHRRRDPFVPVAGGRPGHV